MSRTSSTSGDPFRKRWIDGGAADPRAARAAELLSKIAPPASPSSARLLEIERAIASGGGPRVGLSNSITGPMIAMLALVGAGAGLLWFLEPRGLPQRAPSIPAVAVPEATVSVPAGAPPETLLPAPSSNRPTRSVGMPDVQDRHAARRARGGGSPSRSEGSLDAQARVIGEALLLLRQAHDPDDAIAHLADFDLRFPDAELAREAQAVRAEAQAARRKVSAGGDTGMGTGGY